MYGDSDVIRRRISRLREQAGDIRASADKLVAQSEATPWRGRAAETLRARLKERAVRLRAVADQHEAAAETLGKHLQQVDQLKEAIEAAEKQTASLAEEGRVAEGFEAPPSGHKDWLEVTHR